MEEKAYDNMQTRLRADNAVRLQTEKRDAESTAAAVNRTGNADDDDSEIDLVEVFNAIRQKIWQILLVALIGALLAAGVTRYLITPMYTSTSMMIVLTKETTIASIADLQIGTQLTKDYSVLIQSRPVLEETISNLGLNMTYRDLRDHVTVTNEDDTRILEISVTQSDPKQAKRVCDELTNVSSAYIADKMEVQAPKIIEEGEIPLTKSSPSMSRNVVIGFLIGLILAIAVVIVRYMMNDAIISEEDVEKYLGLTTLASIPDKTQGGNKKKKKKVRRKAEKMEKAGETK